MSVAEHYARFSRLSSNHPSWRLLAATNAPLNLSFVADLFGQTRSAVFSRKSRAGSGAAALEESGWKCKTAPLPTAPLDTIGLAARTRRCPVVYGRLRGRVAVRKGLDRREQSATASHLRIVQDAVRDLSIAMSPDAGVRVRALEVQRQALDREISELQAGVVVQLSDAEQYERLREVYQLASVLTGDIRRLEDDIRQMDHDCVCK